MRTAAASVGGQAGVTSLHGSAKRHVLVLLTTVVTVAFLVAGCGTGQQPDDAAPPNATDDPPDATPTASDEEPDADDAAVALGADGRVVLLDTGTGDELRELLTDVPVDDPASNDLAMTPDGDAVFVVVPPDETGPSEIVRVPVAGGEPESVAQGTVPAVSPDGGTLAYVDFLTFEESARSPEPGLVLRDLDSGEERRLTREQPFHFIADVAWTADGSQVVFTAGEIGTGLYAVDRDAASLDEARRLGPDLEGENEDISWGPVAAYGEDRLAVVETCCGVPNRETWHVVAVGVGDGTVEGSLLPSERVEATHLDSDAEAADLLVVVRGGPSGGELLTWDGSGEPVQIADGVIAATW